MLPPAPKRKVILEKRTEENTGWKPNGGHHIHAADTESRNWIRKTAPAYGKFYDFDTIISGSAAGAVLFINACYYEAQVVAYLETMGGNDPYPEAETPAQE